MHSVIETEAFEKGASEVGLTEDEKNRESIVSTVGSRLIGAAKEARQVARGERQPADTFIPADIDVKSIRKKTGMSQEDFAATFGFSINQIRDWEQMRSRPLGALRAYLILIQSCPVQLADMLSKALTQGDDKAA